MKTVSRPPHIPGDWQEWTSASAGDCYRCVTCDAKGYYRYRGRPMTANVCLARMLQAGLLYTRVDTLHRGVLAAEETLGHEAESRTDRFLLQAPAYVCQHCGAVFIAEGDV